VRFSLRENFRATITRMVGGPDVATPHLFKRISAEVGRSSREQKWRLYAQHFPPRLGERVLDVGVSNLVDLPNENYFLDHYPYPAQVTAVGLNDLSDMSKHYPGVSFVEADGRDLPFETDAFDVVHSNAVIEHVGPEAEQRRFVRELVRVSRSGLVTTPNRWFPVDSHTRLPLLHWLPKPAMQLGWRVFVKRNEYEWLLTNGLWLLSSPAFRGFFPAGVRTKVVHGRILGWPATLNALYRRA